MAIDFPRRCDLAQQLDQNPDLLQNHLNAKLPEWLKRNLAELIQARQGAIKFANWLATHPGEKARSLSNAGFIARLDEEISASNVALDIYRKHGWIEPAEPVRKPAPAELVF